MLVEERFKTYAEYQKTGKVEGNEPLQKFYDQSHELLDKQYKVIQELSGRSLHFLENYLPQIWAKSEAADEFTRKFLAHAPLAGDGGFLKQRLFQYIDEGIKYGLTPISDNPVDLIRMRYALGEKWLTAHRSIAELHKLSYLRQEDVNAPKTTPDGWERINDKIATIYGKDSIKGYWYAPKEVAELFNNYLEPGYFEKNAPNIKNAWQFVANNMNFFQLGISGFHLAFTSMDNVINTVGLAMREASQGRGKDALGTLKTVPKAWYPDWGIKTMREIASESPLTKVMSEFLDLVALGGGRIGTEAEYKVGLDGFTRMAEAWNDKNYIGAALRIPRAPIELVSRAVFDIVGKQKLSVFHKYITSELKRLDAQTLADYEATRNTQPHEWTAEQHAARLKVADIAQTAWRSVDNTLGMMVYDNLFWNKTLKEILMATTRAVGWNLGSFRQILGGGKDLGIYAKDLATGNKANADLTYRASYVLSLALVGGLAGAATQYMLTGKAPDSTKDLFFPQTGGIDEKGDPERVALATYLKDVYAWGTHPLTTAGHKLTPAIAMVTEMLTNKDFYGTEIRNQDDPFMKQAWDATKHLAVGFEPFGIKNMRTMQARGDTGVKPFMSFFGVTPAPRSVNTTPAEQLAMDNITANLPRGSRTQEQRDKSVFNLQTLRLFQKSRNVTGIQARRDAVTEYQAHIKQGLDDGLTDTKKILKLQRSANLSTIQYLFKRQPSFDKALDVFDKADAKERKELKPLLLKKWKDSKMTLKDRQEMLPRLYEALGIKPLKKAE